MDRIPRGWLQLRCGQVRRKVRAALSLSRSQPLTSLPRTVDIVHGTGLAKGKKTPREVILGADGVKWVSKIAEDKVAEIKEWKEFSESTAI